MDGEEELPDCWDNMMNLVGNKEFSMETLKKNSKKYTSMRELLEDSK